MTRFILSRGFEERERAAIVNLLREYETAIGISLCFQGFDAEVAGLPGDYVPPNGEMLLAREAQAGPLVGCVALRGVPGRLGACEMKRMYVREAARGTGLGRQLALAVIEDAGRMGYSRMCLDTLPKLTAAQNLYRSLGFRQTGMSSTEPRVVLFERELKPHDPA
jgi:GNAT superfamily N-acetyltransferase